MNIHQCIRRYAYNHKKINHQRYRYHRSGEVDNPSANQYPPTNIDTMRGMINATEVTVTWISFSSVVLNIHQLWKTNSN